MIRVRFGLLAALFAAHAVVAPAGKLPVLTQARQVRELAPDQADLSYPVHLQAVVTYHDRKRNKLYVQDACREIGKSAWPRVWTTMSASRSAYSCCATPYYAGARVGRADSPALEVFSLHELQLLRLKLPICR